MGISETEGDAGRRGIVKTLLHGACDQVPPAGGGDGA